MENGRLIQLEQRLARLERQNRRLKGWGGALLAGIACLALLAADKPQPKAPNRPMIDTTGIRLWDEHGNLRGLLMCTAKGNAALSLTNEKGEIGATLGVHKDGGGALELLDEKGKMGLRATTGEDGQMVMQFLNPQGEVTQQLPR